MKKKVLLLVDACRYDYLQRGVTPFLESQKSRGTYIKKIIPGNGFCERSEIFTGRSSLELGHFTAIARSSEKTIYGRLDPILRFLDLFLIVFRHRLVNKVLRRILWELASRSSTPMHPYNIPLSFLKYFDLTEDKVDMESPGALKAPTIFDLARENGQAIFSQSFTGLNRLTIGNDQDRLNLVLDRANSDHSLYLVYLGELDAIGHYNGPESEELNAALTRLDQRLMNFCKDFLEKSPETEFILLGDHGMVNVIGHIDPAPLIEKIQKNFGLKVGRDFFYFLDSTMIRVWVNQASNRDKVRAFFLESQELKSKGEFIDRNNATQFQIPSDEGFPDILWWANPGVMVKPDFFHRGDERIVGMHGYLNTYEESKGVMLKFGGETPVVELEERQLKDVFDYLQR